MLVIIKGMQMPEKCCKCPILRKANSMCPLIGRVVVDQGKRHECCPLEEVHD